MNVTKARKLPNGNFVCDGELYLIKANYPNLAGYNLYVLGNTWYKGIIVASNEQIMCGDECYDLNYKCEVTYDQGPKAHLKKIIATSEQFDHKLTNKILTKDIRSGQKLVVICEDQSYDQSIGDKGEFLHIDKFEIKVVEGQIKVILKREAKTSLGELDIPHEVVGNQKIIWGEMLHMYNNSGIEEVLKYYDISRKTTDVRNAD